jgi:spermidine/putrescine transport system permease protein
MLFRNRLIKSIRVAAQVTVGSLILGYPVAYYLAKITTARKQTVVMLITLPLFLSFLVRTYSWYYIFGLKGVISRLLVFIGVTNQPISFLFKESTVFIGLLNWAIIFMVIPIYSAVEKIDVNLLEQAKNLGANEMQTFKEITLPLSLPGVASGCIMTFILSFGSFITPAILGGPGDKMIANLISLMFLNLNNWPMGMTFSVILTIFSLVMMYIYNKLIGLDTLLEALG